VVYLRHTVLTYVDMQIDLLYIVVDPCTSYSAGQGRLRLGLVIVYVFVSINPTRSALLFSDEGPKH